jgi:uncharacterized LabA/DUF88 family protein
VKTAVLIDAGFLTPQLKHRLRRPASASETYEFILKTLEAPEVLFRAYYYDCPPFESAMQHPISGHDLTSPAFVRARQQFIQELTLKDHVAFRKGELSFDGWQIKDATFRRMVNEAATTPPTLSTLQAADISPKLTQKRVDINIGLDVAWLSSKHIVERIVLVTADSDFVPAMKFARREGVQVVLVSLDGHVKVGMREHADIVRSVTYP